MITPRDTRPPLAVAINFETGLPITERQQVHLDAIRETGERLLEAMHYAEGSIEPGEHQEHVFQTPRMRRAAEMIEVAIILARKAALE
jgi:hypothetical protein